MGLVSPVFVGRANKLELLKAGLDRVCAGHPAAFLVGGEAGIGKSRLIGELAGAATELDVRTLTGACVALTDGSAPMLPIVAALRELTDEDPLQPLPGSLDQQWSGAVRQFELLVRRLQELTEIEALLFVVEDIHWADRSTLDFLTFLLRGLAAREQRLMVVATYRTEDVERQPVLRSWLAEAGRISVTQRIQVGRFTSAETAAQIEAILGEPPAPALAAKLFDRSEGNPFIIEELLASAGEGEEGRVPETLHDAFSSRLTALREETRVVLRAAAVAGRRVDHQLLASEVDLPEPGLSEALREATRHQVLVADAHGTGYVFRHALLQEIVYQEVLPGERQRLHARIATALEEDPGLSEGNEATVAAEVSEHWLKARHPRQALAAAVRAGLAAERMHMMAEAKLQFQRALELWPRVADPEELAGRDRATILARLAEVAAALGSHDEALALVDEARALVTGSLRAGLLMERRASYLRGTGRLAEALEAHEAAVAITPAEPASAEAARVRAAYGRTLMLAGRHRDACSMSESAAALAREAGSPADEALALAALGASLIALGEQARSLESLREARRLLEADRVSEGAVIVAVYLADALERAGHFEEAASVAREGLTVGRTLGFERLYGPLVGVNVGLPLFRLGRWDEADEVLAETLAPQPVEAMSTFTRTLRGRIAVARGDFEAAQRHLDAVSPELAGGNALLGCWRARLTAELALWRRRPEDAWAALTAGLAFSRQTADTVPRLELCLTGVRVAAGGVERAVARRRAEEAEAMRVRGAGYLAESAGADEGEASLERAALLAGLEAERSRLAGTPDEEAWTRALVAHEAWGDAYEIAYHRFRTAEALIAGGAFDRAATVLRAAYAESARLGTRPLSEEIGLLGRRAKIELADAPTTPAAAAPAVPASDPEFGLTPREVEVLALLTAGATNRQIAGALHISVKTAGVHVSNILRKLSVSSRGEAAMVGYRAGLVEDSA